MKYKLLRFEGGTKPRVILESETLWVLIKWLEEFDIPFEHCECDVLHYGDNSTKDSIGFLITL